MVIKLNTTLVYFWLFCKEVATEHPKDSICRYKLTSPFTLRQKTCFSAWACAKTNFTDITSGFFVSFIRPPPPPPPPPPRPTPFFRGFVNLSVAFVPAGKTNTKISRKVFINDCVHGWAGQVFLRFDGRIYTFIACISGPIHASYSFRHSLKDFPVY